MSSENETKSTSTENPPPNFLEKLKTWEYWETAVIWVIIWLITWVALFFSEVRWINKGALGVFTLVTIVSAIAFHEETWMRWLTKMGTITLGMVLLVVAFLMPHCDQNIQPPQITRKSSQVVVSLTPPPPGFEYILVPKPTKDEWYTRDLTAQIAGKEDGLNTEIYLQVGQKIVFKTEFPFQIRLGKEVEFSNVVEGTSTKRVLIAGQLYLKLPKGNKGGEVRFKIK